MSLPSLRPVFLPSLRPSSRALMISASPFILSATTIEIHFVFSVPMSTSHFHLSARTAASTAAFSARALFETCKINDRKLWDTICVCKAPRRMSDDPKYLRRERYKRLTSQLTALASQEFSEGDFHSTTVHHGHRRSSSSPFRSWLALTMD